MFSFDAFIYWQVHGSAFARASDCERKPVKVLLQNLNAHLSGRGHGVRISIAISHTAPGWVIGHPSNAAFTSEEKASIGPIAQSVTMAHKY